jgi:uncharacterized protein (TIGR03437 family)
MRFAVLCAAGVAMLAIPVICRSQVLTGYWIKTLVGNGDPGFFGDEGVGTGAEVKAPTTIAFDNNTGKLYIADQGNHCIRALTNDGLVDTYAGIGGSSGYAGDDEAPDDAHLSSPYGVAVDAGGRYYIADTQNHVIRKVDVENDIITTIVGSTSTGAGYQDDDYAIDAKLNKPTGLALDDSGNLYIADTGNNRIRVLRQADGSVGTVAGNGYTTLTGDGGGAIRASLNAPTGVAADHSGNLYIADTGNNVIRKVSNGIISTVAGTGTAGFAGDGGLATKAQLHHPQGIVVDDSGNLIIADTYNSRIRMVTTDGTIVTIAGDGYYGYTSDDVAATSASLFFPAGVALDASGNIYVADTQNNLIRKLSRRTDIGRAPSLKAGKVISASQFGAFNSIAPGSWIEIYGSDLASVQRSWTGSDFAGTTAPTSLTGTSVSIGGQDAFISYVSGSQVNALVPSTVAPGSQTVTVTTPNGTSEPLTITVNATQGGFFAPQLFQINGRQYAGAFFQDGTYVLPTGAVQGANSRPAKPGEIITLWGTGFGSVAPDISAGQIAYQLTSLTLPLNVYFGQIPATVRYAGLCPGTVGLYQFNIEVPSVPDSDAVPLTFTLNGVSGVQTLYTAVKN